MNDTGLLQFRTVLQRQLADLEAGDDLGRDAQKTVSLDQQSVGRLSRMDALQQQSMALANNARRANMRSRIKSALRRMEQGEFGFCSDCGDDIAPKRLELDPTVSKCISCANG